MCLMMELKAPAIAREVAGTTSSATAVAGFTEIHAVRQSRGSEGSRFFVGARESGCACLLLDDATDITKNQIVLNPAAIDALEKTLKLLLHQSGPSGFTVRAAYVRGSWEDLRRRTRRQITLSRLLKNMRANTFRFNVEYHVLGGAV